jgi:hypothetical protein
MDPEGRYRVALVLAVATGISVVSLTVAALKDVLADPTQSEISTQYAALITSTLGVLVGGLVAFISGRSQKDDEPDE